jgi:hypothetical protein
MLAGPVVEAGNPFGNPVVVTVPAGTRPTADRTRPATMLQGSIRRTPSVSLLIRRLQVRVLPGRKAAGQRLEVLAVLALWQSLSSNGAFRTKSRFRFGLV